MKFAEYYQTGYSLAKIIVNLQRKVTKKRYG